MDVSLVVEKLRKGDIRALARVLSAIEDEMVEGQVYVEKLFPLTGHAYVIGITGPPGAGKSTLVDQLIVNFRKLGKRVAVLAIDPSSPFTGGAVLGDRIRMAQGAEAQDVFIRSMATRGALGGIAPRTTEALFAIDAAGFDIILLETVGVGQVEVEVVRAADTVAVVLVPGMGDSVQALKAGILEIADIFVVNKSDKAGADQLLKDLRTVLSLGSVQAWTPEIVSTVALEGRGSEELVAAISKHHKWSEESKSLDVRRKRFLRQAFDRQLADLCLLHTLEKAEKSGVLAKILEQLFARKLDPLTLAKELLDYR